MESTGPRNAQRIIPHPSVAVSTLGNDWVGQGWLRDPSTMTTGALPGRNTTTPSGTESWKRRSDAGEGLDGRPPVV